MGAVWGAQQCCVQSAKVSPAVASCCEPSSKGKEVENDAVRAAAVIDEPLKFAQEFMKGFEATSYVIKLDKSGGGRLGMDVDHLCQSPGLPVRNIVDGLAVQWNRSHPKEPINPGDVIVEVNGVSGDVTGLLERCRLDEVLNITLVRVGVR